MTITFSEAQDQAFYQLKHFLKQHGEAAAGKGDRNFIALHHPQHIIGCARLIALDEEACFWLRGLFVAPDWRHQGIASQLLQYMHRQTQQAGVFAFAEGHLAGFYQQAGYRPCSYADLPPSLQRRYSAEKISQQRWLTLRYEPTISSR
ncbi:GNAT family N-acetyltransferase [Thiomicrorhabdus cannonii]|uniref:GNAT family N-acetyltransferase n=1 Tax=Thiomicrorhabdus cannonii TaxID=2748011 RepID=UPI0015BAEF8F|nr:GNAT family N-acetyltransferase [Thiomicrorhabdus cannonii]